MKLDLLANSTSSAIKHQRLWGFFTNFKDAERSVLENRSENHSNIFEYYYNIALIEEYYVYDSSDDSEIHISLNTPTQWWYQATYYPEPNDRLINPTICKIEQPKCFSHTCNFWAG